MRQLKLIYIILLLLISTVWTGCEKELEIQPNNESMVTDVEHFHAMLVASGSNYWVRYSVNRQIAMSDQLDWTDAAFNYAKETTDDNTRTYLWLDQVYRDDATEPWDWYRNYNIIYQTNYILERIDDAPVLPGNESQRLYVKGRALALRAYSLFALVNNYAKHYNPATAATDKGIPMPLVNSDELAPRSSVEEVYRQIIADATESLEYLPDIHPFFGESYANFVPGKLGVLGFLSRAYLYMATDNSSQSNDYLQKAIDAANECIEITGFLYDLNEVNTPDIFDNLEIIWNRNTSGVGRGLSANNNPELSGRVPEETMALYEPGDLRGLHNKHKIVTSGDRMAWKPNRLHIGVYLSEVYLNKAEAQARLGQLDEAYITANELRAKRFATGSEYQLDATGMTQADVIKEIINEKIREFGICESRWWDQKRLILLGEYNKTITRKAPSGETYTLEPNSVKYVIEFPWHVRNIRGQQFTNR